MCWALVPVEGDAVDPAVVVSRSDFDRVGDQLDARVAGVGDRPAHGLSREAQVSRADRNTAGDWSPDSTLTDDVYNRPDGTIEEDPLDAVPLYGRPDTVDH